MNTETHTFKAETRKLLHLVVHSLYSNKEIFLRELVSNASDALDKLRFAAVSKPELLADDPELRVEISFDTKARQIVISDNGIGMSRDEAATNLGTIAHSGTRAFVEQLNEADRAGTQLIGQFGVGFYSAFIVAERVEVYSRQAGAGVDDGVLWASDGVGDYTLESRSGLGRGTRIVLTLKDSEGEFLNSWKLREILKRYSNHLPFPVRLKQLDGEDGQDFETVNDAQAIWLKPKAEVSDEDYAALYKQIAHDFDDPLAYAHNHVEGNQNYVSLLYVPKRRPFLLYGNNEQREGLKLYVRRVFIMDAAETLLPPWLRFVRGVVDSDDLPLNVSRELLQDSAHMTRLKAAVVKRSLDLIERLAKDESDKFQAFYKEFGPILKEGVAEHAKERDRLVGLLRFATTTDATGLSSLADVYGRMKAGQDAIYYLTADTVELAGKSAQLERLRALGVEVLLLGDRIDDWMMGQLGSYEGKPLRAVAKGELSLEGLLDSTEREAFEARVKAAAPLTEKLAKALDDVVAAVRVSPRLTDGAACLVGDSYDLPLHLKRLLEQAGQNAGQSKPTLEIRPEHPLVARLQAETDESRFVDLARLTYDQALLAEGGVLAQPQDFVARLNRLLLSTA